MMAKLERIIFYVFVFAVPFQTRIILKSWGNGFNEWNSAFLYGTDILILALFLFWLIRKVNQSKSAIHLLENSRATSRGSRVGGMADLLSSLPLFIFLGIAAISLSIADNLALGLYRLIKILEFAGLYFYVRASLGKTIGIKESFLAVIASGVFQSLIAIGQSMLQRSLDLKWLGESILRINFNGVAVVPAVGGKFLRAYGTTPHPNVLAAWLFLSIFAFYFWYFYLRAKKSSIYGLAVFLVYPILLWGLFSTFSRVAISLWGMGVIVRLLIVWLKRKKYNLDQNFKKRMRLLFVVTAATAIIFSFFYWPQVQSRLFISSQEQAVSQRIFYAKTAGEMILSKPWLGVGLGQFVATMMATLKNYPSYVYQPVHNIYLLIMSETGFLGLIAFIGWLAVLFYEYIKSTRFKFLYQTSFFIVFSSILIMGLFDHFLWTLQQGQLIFWLTMGLAASSLGEKSIIEADSEK